MPDVYATRADLYRFGLPRGMLANPARLCASVKAATDTFELDGHGFDTDDPLIVRVDADAGGEMPAPLVDGVTVYAIPVDDSRFKVAAVPAGAATDLTTDGVNVFVATPLAFDKVLESCSRFVDDHVPHLVPFTAPYPPSIVDTVAELAATRLAQSEGLRSEALDRAEAAARARLDRWQKGAPVRDARATASSNLAYSESAPAPTGGRDWGPSGCLP